jgi:hypothetical protein
VSVNDLGGNATTYPITVLPLLGETIAGSPSATITSAYGIINLLADVQNGGWSLVSGSTGITGGLGDAPSDGNLYGRENATWTVVPPVPAPGIIPENSQSANYTLIASDAGKFIYHPASDANARTFTIPANATVAYTIGTVISFVNLSANALTLAINTDTLYLSGYGPTGPIAIAQYGCCTALKIDPTNWIVSGAGLTGSTSPGGDTYWANVVLLCGFEGANNATTISDESSRVHGAATFNNSAHITTTFHQFGSSSLAAAYSSHDYITWPGSADWNISGAPFTIECWVNLVTSGSGAAARNIIGVWGSGVGGPELSWLLQANGTALSWYVSTNGTNSFNDLSGGTLTTGTSSWQHAAVDFDGTTYRLYLAGTCVATSTTSRSIYAPAGQVLNVGSYLEGTQYWFDGYIDELRITKGTARYASSTTYTVPTAAFPRHG